MRPASYPIAATATAEAYDFEEEQEEIPTPAEPGQQTLFPPQPRRSPIPLPQARDFQVTRLDLPKSESTRARPTEISRPAPLKVGKVEVSPRSRRTSNPEITRKAGPRMEQQRLDLFGEQQVLTQPQSTIICNAPVAPCALRSQAALVDLAVMLVGCILAGTAYNLAGGSVILDKHVLPFVILSLATIPIAYKFLWAYFGLDSVGMSAARLRLIDFDGNPPSRERRMQRTFGSFISFLAVGIGLVWALVDQDGLTWHDHMSGTFPTLR
ncbi:MAG: RDD family protein [Bryobacteraceae bacterium]